MNIKQTIRAILGYLNLDLTKNLSYDRLTRQIMQSFIRTDSNCIDVGCHKGEILELIEKFSPNGKHFAFEPIPVYYDDLCKRFPNVTIHPVALSDRAGETSYKHVLNAPAYSGIKERKYQIDQPEIKEIKVPLDRLDDILPSDIAIDFIKVDVEGGEFDVFKGAENTLKKHQPLLIFESGLGASEYYGTIPEELFQFFEQLGYKLYLLKDFIKGKEFMSEDDFVHVYLTNKEYYFVALHKTKITTQTNRR